MYACIRLQAVSEGSYLSAPAPGPLESTPEPTANCEFYLCTHNSRGTIRYGFLSAVTRTYLSLQKGGWFSQSSVVLNPVGKDLFEEAEIFSLVDARVEGQCSEEGDRAQPGQATTFVLKQDNQYIGQQDGMFVAVASFEEAVRLHVHVVPDAKYPYAMEPIKSVFKFDRPEGRPDEVLRWCVRSCLFHSCRL